MMDIVTGFLVCIRGVWALRDSFGEVRRISSTHKAVLVAAMALLVPVIWGAALSTQETIHTVSGLSCDAKIERMTLHPPNPALGYRECDKGWKYTIGWSLVSTWVPFLAPENCGHRFEHELHFVNNPQTYRSWCVVTERQFKNRVMMVFFPFWYILISCVLLMATVYAHDQCWHECYANVIAAVLMSSVFYLC